MQPRKKLSEIVKDMDKLKQQWAATTPAPDTNTPIPAGEYVCGIVSGEAFQARTGTPGFKVTLRVMQGTLAGRLVWHDYYLTENSLPYTMRALEKIGITDLEQLDGGLPSGLVVKAKIVVNKRDGGGERNEVRAWELMEVNSPEEPTAPAAPPQSAQPANGNPWAVDLDTLNAETQTKGDDATSFDFGANAGGAK